MSWSGLVGDVAGVGYGDVEAASFLGDAQGADDDDVVAGEVTDAGVEVVLDAAGLVVADHDGGCVPGPGAGLVHQVQEDALGGGVLGVVGDLSVEACVKPRVLWRLVYLVPVVTGCDCSWLFWLTSGTQAASCSAGVRIPIAE